MKIAFLLTLYTQPKQANLFIEQLLKYENSFIFVHVDKKFKHIENEIIQHERVVIIPNSESIEWGDFSQIQSILNLMEFATDYGKFEYFSINSGHDLIVRPINELVEFLSKDNIRAYLDCNSLPAKGWQYKGGLGRIELMWPKIFRQKLTRNSPLRYLRKLYVSLYEIGIIKGKKMPEGITFYGGSDWFTVRGNVVEYMLGYLEANPEFVRLFEEALIGSEIFFNTLICNMPSDSKVITDNNIRYIDWTRVSGQSIGSPKTLINSDFDKIIASGKFFARKFDIDVSGK